MEIVIATGHSWMYLFFWNIHYYNGKRIAAATLCFPKVVLRNQPAEEDEQEFSP